MIDALSPQSAVLQKGLDAVWKKNEAIAANIANAETPGYKSVSVDFESVFREVLGTDRFSALSDSSSPALTALNAADLERLEPEFSENSGSAMRMDGNNVDLDAEMTELAKNSILYDTLTYSLSREIGRLRLIIDEGK